MIGSRDVQEIVSKLSSDKAKAREEGIKLLSTWLEGERSISLCKFLGQNTAKLRADEIPHSETWPFIITLLIQCSKLEISSSKRRLPKLIFAKTLRISVQRAEDARFSGKLLPLLSVVKPLFNHIWDVLNNVPSFQSEYGIILRHILAVRAYCSHMRKRIYCNLVFLYMEKIDASLNGESRSQFSSKDEVFRCIMTLHSLLENPPGDYPDSIREHVVRGFIGIFSFIRDEGKISRKLIECINTYLLKDGPNLACETLELHNSVKQFLFRFWPSTHDRLLKDAFFLYGKLQLNLTRGDDHGNCLVEEFLDVVCKDLDQCNNSSTAMFWNDGGKDDKFGALSSSLRGLVELAAALFYRACLKTSRPPASEKRVKREQIAVILKDALTEGKWLWNATFCYLIHNYHTRICKDLLLYWFEGLSTSFDRILNDANVRRAYDGLLWTLRSLQELSSVLLLPNSKITSSCTLNENSQFTSGWQLIWNSVVHGLPIFSNITTLADAALVLLANITSIDLINTPGIPRDVWDLRLFKRDPSLPVLFFITCYFSRRISQGDVQDILHIRRDLLTAVLGHLNFQGSAILNERMVLFMPAASYALCAGSAPFLQCCKEQSLLFSFLDVADAMAENPEYQRLHVPFECSVEVLAKIDSDSRVEVSQFQSQPHVHLPWQIGDRLLHELETCVLKSLDDRKSDRMPLAGVFFICALLSNLIYGSLFTRKKDSSFVSQLGQYLLEMVNFAVDLVQNNCNSKSLGFLSYGSSSDETNSIAVSIRSFICSPIFHNWEDHNMRDIIPSFGMIIQSIEKLVKLFGILYEQNSVDLLRIQPGIPIKDLSTTDSILECPCSEESCKSRIMDMDLDIADNSKDVDSITVGRINASDSISGEKWKLGLISLISSFFSVLPVISWENLFELVKKESDPKVQEKILHHLCQQPHWSSSAKLMELVSIMNEMINVQLSLELNCIEILAATQSFIGTLLSSDAVCTDKCDGTLFKEMELEQCFLTLGDLIDKAAGFDHFMWAGRVKLIHCICNFILLSPEIGQAKIERLLSMLHDPDFRVRLFLARHIGILFQTWEGHEELFQDICSNFGVPLVVYSKDRIITAKEVLASGPQPRPTMETVIITLMHLALNSEKVELEAVFMMSAVSAINPCLRELVFAVLDNLSRQLQYTTRMKYLEELMGSILFCWVSCGISLVSLVEIRQLFVSDAEPSYFMQFCCNWLLPALLIHEDVSDLNWIAKVACQDLPNLVKNHFVPIFSICMALHCSGMPGSEKGTIVLQHLIQKFAEITEIERDQLIKKHMVSIVNYILSLSYCSSDAGAPFFSRDTVSCAIRAVVDGFLEMENCDANAGVVDKINIFRPDRVFMFIVEIHYKITAAVHHRHRCHRLAGIEVLINVLGHRAAVSSTSNYLFNLVGHLFGSHALQDQCCRIISLLWRAFRSNSFYSSKEMTCVLGEQLQFLVSKLVDCCISSETQENSSKSRISEVLTLLHQLTVDSDPSLYDYIRELEPFPELEIFKEIQKFHEHLCQDYSIRDHLLKFVKRACYLPPRLLLSSLQALHKKFLTIQRGDKGEELAKDGHWYVDNEIVDAIWELVHMCSSNDLSSARELVSDFISWVGVGDPHCVVFHLPGDLSRIHVGLSIDIDNGIGMGSYVDAGISEELLIALFKILKKYLMDDSVKIVDIASQLLRGILSTERGQRALQSFGSYERSVIEVHSKGFNVKLVQNLLLHVERKFEAEAISLEDSNVWQTLGKTFEMWICPLVYSLIGYCNDVILRLCQDMVLLKAEVAELLLPSIIVNLGGRKDLNFDLQKLISMQVQEYILSDSNELIKSIQVWLNCLNKLRICHVFERSSASSKRENPKSIRLSSNNSKSRSTSSRARDSAIASSSSTMLTLAWDKVYWLSIDYLVVAKSAVSCGSYFTSMMYVEHWCEERFQGMTLGSPDFSHDELLPCHVEILVSAVTQINEPDSLYGILQSHKLTSQITTFEHEGNWGKALEYYDLQVRMDENVEKEGGFSNLLVHPSQSLGHLSFPRMENGKRPRKPYKGLIRSLQQIGCMHVLDLYCQGLTSGKGQLQLDNELSELQYEAAWRGGNWDFSLPHVESRSLLSLNNKFDHFNENLHSCLKALQEGNIIDFQIKLRASKQELVWSVSDASEESTEYIYLSIIKLQIFYHLGLAWDLRWRASQFERTNSYLKKQNLLSDPAIPSMEQLSWLNKDWLSILERTQMHINLLEPFIAFRGVLLQILSCRDCTLQHLLQSASTLRKGSRFSQASAALHEFKVLSFETKGHYSSLYWLGRLEEAKLLRSQGQHEMAISLAKYISQNYESNEETSDVYRLIGKWLAETRSSNSRTILEKYLKLAVILTESQKTTDNKDIKRQSQTHFHLAHYADALFRSHDERLNSNEWQAAMRLRKHKTIELEALIKRLKSSTKGDKADYSVKIQELQKQLAMDKEEAQKLEDDRDNFLSLALEGYKRCLVISDKYDVRVVFRLVSLWFTLSSRQNVVNSMLETIDEVQSYKFVPLVYQIASRMGSSKDVQGPQKFQFALVSLVKKMAIDHPYHTIFQLLALANGDRIKDKQRSRSSYVVDMDKKYAAEKFLKELSSYHGAIIAQMKQMVEIYIKLAELETRREDTNKRVTLPRELRNLQPLELVPVVTATFAVDRSCQYHEGSFPYFSGLADSVMVMNGINAPKVVECLGSDGHRYRQLAKSGNDDLRQDAVMEQFFGLVNTFLRNHRDTWKRRLGVRTYKVVPFTPSAGVLEWVNGTLPLGEYLIGSTRNGGAHGRYGRGDWPFLKCREHMSNERDKRKAFQEVCKNFRPVMHYFFLERFLQPADWFEKRLAYTRSVAASSMVGYIVGLGDRHSMNILIDQATAEVVHIDLGVAFEQGLMLKTPERVPFRLTRDVIDGMGVSGVEGVFRRCCEETLSVMRTNKEALMTIVEVFIHDPLYKWALSPLKALQRQKDTHEDLETILEESPDEYEGNKDAARALMRVKQKLDGYEEGEMRSVHGQVQQLIQDAIDPERLCHMFPGWGAWL